MNNEGTPVEQYKTVFGSMVYVCQDDLERALKLNRLVTLRDKNGEIRDRGGEKALFHPGNLLTDKSRKIVRYEVIYPGEPATRGYWYADDMKDGMPAYMAG